MDKTRKAKIREAIIRLKLGKQYSSFLKQIEKNIIIEGITANLELLFLTLILHISHSETKSNKEKIESIKEKINKKYKLQLEKISKLLEEGIKKYSQIIETQKQLPEEISNTTKTLIEEMEKLYELGTQYSWVIYEKLFIDLYQSFESLLFNQLKIICISMPNLFFDEEKKITATYEDIFLNRNIKFLKEIIVEQKIKELIQSNNTYNLFKKIENRLGIKLKIPEKLLEEIYVASKKRNILVHNNGIINNIYIKELKKYGISSEYQINDSIKERIKTEYNKMRNIIVEIADIFHNSITKNLKQIINYSKSK